MLASTKSQGEPLVSFFTLDTIEQKLRAFGFSAVERPSPEYLSSLFEGRTDGLAVPRRAGLALGTVG